MKQPMIDTMEREKFDNLYTPREAIKLLVKYIPQTVQTIWECTDFGKSKITEVLKEHGYKVISTDIETDFLKYIQFFKFDAIITNPPYSLKDRFIERCMYYEKPFALLLPITALEGIKRGQMFKKCGMSVVVINKRLDFTGKKANWFNTSWFCGNGFTGENELFFEDIERYR